MKLKKEVMHALTRFTWIYMHAWRRHDAVEFIIESMVFQSQDPTLRVAWAPTRENCNFVLSIWRGKVLYL
jgi:hypothetical protein